MFISIHSINQCVLFSLLSSPFFFFFFRYNSVKDVNDRMLLRHNEEAAVEYQRLADSVSDNLEGGFSRAYKEILFKKSTADARIKVKCLLFTVTAVH